MNKRIRKKKRHQYNKWLCERYPFLTPRNVWTDKVIPTYDWTLLDDMPRGWRKAFGLQMCEDLREELIKFNYLDDYRVDQIKEKYGGLRWYDNGCPVGSKIGDIINTYGIISENVCVSCGKLDVPMTDTGWILPMCEKCFCGRRIRYNADDYKRATEDSPCEIRTEYTTRRYIPGTDDVVIEKHDITDVVNRIRAKKIVYRR